MIQINKDITIAHTPPSLRFPVAVNFSPRNIARPSKTTNKRRFELIRAGVYIDNDNYNSRYKFKDIKRALKTLYKNKCAYCEQKVEQFHVEHYRPKQIYYWLAFSWDNLISACSYCNEYKDINFQITGAQATLDVSLNSIRNINTLSASYDLTETPDLVNPEITNPDGNLVFHLDGSVTSPNARFTYTINTCHVHRTFLNDSRKKILDDLRRDLKGAFVDNPTTVAQGVALQTIITRFRADLADNSNEFLAFRKYVLDHWLASEIKNAKN